MAKEFKKVKITKLKVLEVEFSEINDKGITTGHHAVRFTSVIHPDLETAMDRMIPHFLVMVELKQEREVRDIIQDQDSDRQIQTIRRSLQSYKVSTISIGGSDDTRGVIISGKKTLGNGKVTNINTPFYTFEEIHALKFGEDFMTSYDALLKEVDNYTTGKVDPSQGNIFDGENETKEALSKVD